MRKSLFAKAALWVALILAGTAAGTAVRSDARHTRSRSYGSRLHRSRHPVRRASRRPIIRHTVVSLPQLRTELSRLENGLGTRVRQIERVVSRPPKPAVVITPVAPPAVPIVPGLPVGTAVGAAITLAAITGALGTTLGYTWGRRHAALQTRLAAPGGMAAEGGPEEDPEARPWPRLREKLDETQQRLSVARARLRRLEP